MKSLDNRKRYLLPDVIDPGAYRCTQVYIPDDPVYFAAFWGAYEYFTKWLAWGADPLHKGQIAAAVWQTAYDMSRVKWNEGDCGVNFDLRTKPGDPHTMQATTDGGATWHDAYQSCCEDTVDTMTQDDITQQITNVIRNVIIPMTNAIQTSIAGGHTKDEFMTDYLSQPWLGVPGPGAIQAISDIYDHVHDNPTPTAPYADDCTYMAIVNKYEKIINEHCGAGSSTVQCATEFWAQAWNYGVDFWQAKIDQYLQSVGWNKVFQGAALNTCEGTNCGEPNYGASCPWDHTWDFASGEQGWTGLSYGQVGPFPLDLVYYADTGATLVSGEWYTPEPAENIGPTSNSCSLTRMQLQSSWLYGSLVEYVEVTVHSDSTTYMPGARDVDVWILRTPYQPAQGHDTPFPYQILYHGTTVLNPGQVQLYGASFTPTPVYNLYVLVSITTFGCLPADIFLSKVRMTGHGVNPFSVVQGNQG